MHATGGGKGGGSPAVFGYSPGKGGDRGSPTSAGAGA